MTSPSGSRRPMVVPRMDPAKEMEVDAVRSAPFCGARWNDWPPPSRRTAAAEEIGELRRNAAGGAVAAGVAAAAAGEQAAEEVLEAGPAGCAAAAAGGEPCAAAHGPDGVVLLALIGIREHGIGLGDVLELLLRSGVPRVGVRVVLPRELPVGLLDVGVGSVLGDSKDLVKVLVHPVLASQWRFLSKFKACEVTADAGRLRGPGVASGLPEHGGFGPQDLAATRERGPLSAMAWSSYAGTATMTCAARRTRSPDL